MRYCVTMVMALLLFQIGRAQVNANAGANEILLTDLIHYKVRIKDTVGIKSLPKPISSREEYNQGFSRTYLPVDGFRALSNSIIDSAFGKAIVTTRNFEPIGIQNLSTIFGWEYSEALIDAEGNEIGFRNKRTAYVAEDLTALEFFEEWYYNPQTRVIRKSVLGYAVWALMWDNVTNRFHETILYYVLKDKSSIEVLKAKGW